MRITFQPKQRDKTRLMLPISEFNLAGFPIQVSATKERPGSHNQELPVGAGILANLEAFRRTTGGMDKRFRVSEPTAIAYACAPKPAGENSN